MWVWQVVDPEDMPQNRGHGFDTNFMAGDGAAIAYRLWRPGQPRRTIVAIHGLASNLTRWSEFAATTRLKESWDILRLDLRGHGNSLFRGRVGFDEWCADLAALLRAEGVTESVLLGHCLGANVALWFAQREPAFVRGLVLIEPMFRQALAGEMLKAVRLRPWIVAVMPLLRGIAALGMHRRHLDELDLEQLDREARAAMVARRRLPRVALCLHQRRPAWRAADGLPAGHAGGDRAAARTVEAGRARSWRCSRPVRLSPIRR